MPPRELREFVCPLLQPPLNRLFVPRPIPDYIEPTDRDVPERTGSRFSSLACYMADLEAAAAKAAAECESEQGVLSADVIRKQKIEAKKRASRERIAAGVAEWNPKEQLKERENVTGDSFKTLMVGSLDYQITERQLKREFERFGPVRKVCIVKEKESGKPRGYAFIEFERERDLKAAFAEADGIRVEGRRIFVDVERGRTVPGWLPRRLGGGLGRSRVGSAQQNQRYTARDPRATIGLASADSRAKRSRSRSRSPSPPPRRR